MGTSFFAFILATKEFAYIRFWTYDIFLAEDI